MREKRRGVVRGIGEGRRENVALSRMEVATTWVDPKGPGREGSGFPSREREGIVEKGGEGGEREGERRGREGIENGGKMRGEGSGGVKEGKGRRRYEPEEGIGLVGPVEPTGSASVTRGERMLGPVVVRYRLGRILGLVLLEMVG